MKPLDQVIADNRGELAVLRKHGQRELADALERVLEEIAEAAAPFTVWLREGEAQLRSGKSRQWLRARFGAWERQGLGRWNPHRPTERQYLACVIPQDRNLDAVRADAAREAARQAS